MAEDKTPKESTMQEPHHAPGHDHEVEQLKELLGRFGTPVLAAVVVALLFIVGFGSYRSFQTSSSDQASLALADAETLEDFQSILADFSKTPSAPIAQLGAAAKYFEDGEYEASGEAYAAFAADNPGHPMADGATLAQVQCLEAAGKTEEALQGFAQFLADRPDTYLAPNAALGRARCLTQLNRTADARSAYEDVIASHPESVWSARAEAQLKQVERLLRLSAAP